MVVGKQRTRLAPAVRRRMILDAATSPISARGYKAMTLAKLAEACGMTNAGMLHYFGSKEELLLAVLDQQDAVNEESVASLSFDRSTRDGARAFMDVLVERDVALREIVRLYVILGAETLDESHPAFTRLADRSRRIREQAAALVEGWHPEPERFVTMVQSYLDGLQANWLRDPSLDLFREWSYFADLAFGSHTS